MLAYQKFIIIGEDYYNSLSAIRALGQEGIYPDFIAIKYKTRMASKSIYLNKVHLVETLDEAFEVLISKYGDERRKPFVISTGDDIQELLDNNYSTLKKKFILFNAGEDGRVTTYMNKKTILDLAEKHGLRVAKSVAVNKGEIPDEIEYPIITKSISPNIGGWKSDVFICNSASELEEAYRKIESPIVLLQKFIEKKNEICLDGFSINHGRDMFIPTATTYNYSIRGYYSPYMTAYPLSNEDIKHGILEMLREIGFEGIFSAEFIVDEEGEFYFTEINFRYSPWSYMASKLGMSVPYLWAVSTLSGLINEDWYKEIPDDFTAMIEPIDYQKRVVEGNTSLAEWLVDLRNTSCPFYLDEKDLEPFNIMVKNWEQLN